MMVPYQLEFLSDYTKRGSSLPMDFHLGLESDRFSSQQQKAIALKGFCYFWGSRWELALVSWQPPTLLLTSFLHQQELGLCSLLPCPSFSQAPSLWRHMRRSLLTHMIVPCIWEFQLTHPDTAAQTLPLMICSSFSYFLLPLVGQLALAMFCQRFSSWCAPLSLLDPFSIQFPWLPCDLSPLIFSRKVL